MGNRAYIVGKDSDKAIYLHWNGGRDSVEGFLYYAKLRGFPGLNSGEGKDGGYYRLLTVLMNFFGNSGLHVYPCSGEEARTNDPGDNGTYVVDGWDIVGRINAPRTEQKMHSVEDIAVAVDSEQPTKDQLGEQCIRAEG